MIALNFGTNSNVITTLYESSSNITNPEYTFSIINKDSKVETIFYPGKDNSLEPWYYNSFTISVATYSGLTSSIIEYIVGEYEYTVYEMPDAYNLNIASASNIVERGILNIYGTSSGVSGLPEYLNTNDTIPVFRGV